MTSERILLFHAESWSLMLEDDLESIVEVVLPPLSDVPFGLDTLHAYDFSFITAFASNIQTRGLSHEEFVASYAKGSSISS